MSDANNEDLALQVAQLMVRVAELEDRVAKLEGRGGTAAVAASGTTAAPDRDALIEAIRVALSEINEGDAGAIRQQLVKNGQPSSLTRSDVNKALYSRKDLFQVARQEGNKPMWQLA